jgi:hypothetical protein
MYAYKYTHILTYSFIHGERVRES